LAAGPLCGDAGSEALRLDALFDWFARGLSPDSDMNPLSGDANHFGLAEKAIPVPGAGLIDPSDFMTKFKPAAHVVFLLKARLGDKAQPARGCRPVRAGSLKRPFPV
jgi:hypothetical protein